MSVNLQYNYAKIDTATGRCKGCATMSYEINNPAYIPVPYATDDYYNKYYNVTDGLWYLDADFSTIWADAPTW